MDLRATFEQEQLRATLRRLLDQRLAAAVDALPDPPRLDRATALADAAAVGLFGLGLPDSAGGAGGFADLAVAHEELGRGLAPSLLTVQTLAARLVLRVGGARAGGLLARLADGTLLATPALDDPPAGDVTTVHRDGDRLHLRGRKRQVVNARDVDEVLVAARDAASGTTAVVRVPVAGVQWETEVAATDVPQSTLTLDGVELPTDALLAADADASLASYRLDATVLAAARLLGGGRAVLDRTVGHVRTREQFDRPIGTFQAVQHQLADVATDLDACGLAVAQAAWAVDADLPAAERSRLAAIAGLAAADAFRAATLVAHQLHGGMGFVLDSPLHLWSARAVADPTVGGSRRQLLDELAAAEGISDVAVRIPADHRAAPAGG